MIEILFSLDTTGSMGPCLEQCKRNLDSIMDPLFKSIPGLKVGFIAHGDYCDRDSTYVLRHHKLTTDSVSLKSFIRDTTPTGGGDADECYELVLNRARSFAWEADKSRVLIMIGDCEPHGVNYKQNVDKLDWKNESKMLAEMGVKIYSVQCLNRTSSDYFYEGMAKLTNGVHLHLHQFRYIQTLLQGVAYKQDSQESLNTFEQDLRKTKEFGQDLEDLFDDLNNRPKKTKKIKTTGKLVPVSPGRFQIFEVHGEPSIKDFVKSMGITFKTGRGFYPHISRVETIQEKKEIVLESKATGEMFTGEAAREMLGVPYGVRKTLQPNPLKDYIVYIQSTSNNRILREKGFLYEVPD